MSAFANPFLDDAKTRDRAHFPMKERVNREQQDDNGETFGARGECLLDPCAGCSFPIVLPRGVSARVQGSRQSKLRK